MRPNGLVWRQPGGEIATSEDAIMMHDMMGGGMMWGMSLFGLAVLVIALLAIAALVKFVFFR